MQKYLRTKLSSFQSYPSCIRVLMQFYLCAILYGRENLTATTKKYLTKQIAKSLKLAKICLSRPI